MRSSVLLASLLSLVMAGCLPCGCEEATLVNPPLPGGAVLKITFHDSVLPWVADRFTVTVVQEGTATSVDGTYKKDGDTIRFDVAKALPFLSVTSGTVNALSCDDAKGEFTVTPPAAAGVPALPVTFKCTKKG